MFQFTPLIGIPLLVLAHVLADLVVIPFSAPRWPSPGVMAFFALTFAQVSLIGIWVGIGRCWLLLRLIVGAIVVALEYALAVAFKDANLEILFLMGGSAVAAAIALLVSRLWHVRLIRLDISKLTDATEGLKFSIRHLLYLTIAVAMLLTIGRSVSVNLGTPEEWPFIIALSICFASIALTSVWASLGTGIVPVRMLVLLLISYGTGFIPPYYWVSIRGGFIAFPILTGLLGLIGGGSVLVCRACGYRVVQMQHEAR